MFKAFILPIFIIALISNCKNDSPTTIERPTDPWAMRSVLDQRPGILTLALLQNNYAAYDTRKCALYKVWKGGVNWEGAVFNNAKSIQPSSWGDSFILENPDENPWSIIQDGHTKALNVQFKGYFLKQNTIQFHYQISTPKGQVITIFEQPDILLKENDLLFTRSFQTKNVPKDVEIFYRDHALQNNTTTAIQQQFKNTITPRRPAPNTSDPVSLYWLDRNGCNTCHEIDEQTVGPSYQQIADKYDQELHTIQSLVEKVKKGGAGVWGTTAMNPHPQINKRDIERMVRFILSYAPEKEPSQKKKKTKKQAIKTTALKPGFGAPLEGIHPAFKVQTIRPKWFKPRVGGMDFLSDGRLLVSTWDSIGGVYALSGLETGDTNTIQIERIAAGLSEPLGLKVVDGDIFVLQKHELTQLIDHDKDGITDEYKTICNTWDVTDDFHEYAYGLEYKDGYFYVNLGLAMRLMGHELQLPDRGTCIKISKDGQYHPIVTGLRQANGIGIGPDGALFATENQGQWVPASKLIHLQQGDFHGCQFGRGDRFKGQQSVPPAIWMPHDEIGNSPSQPILMPHGPYAGQLLYGEVTHGGIKRVSLEKINGQYQGALFRFSQGLEAGINRLAWGPDQALYVGGVGMNGNWGWKGKQFGLQRLVYTNTIPFEMLAVRVIADGLEVEFTQPVGKEQGNRPADFYVQQWRYEITPSYGGPKVDLENLTATSIHWSEDRKKVQLILPDLKEGHVIYLKLPETLRNTEGANLWSGECWYTLNQKRKRINNEES